MISQEDIISAKNLHDSSRLLKKQKDLESIEKLYKDYVPLEHNLENYVIENFMPPEGLENDIVNISIDSKVFYKAVSKESSKFLWINCKNIILSCMRKDLEIYLEEKGESKVFVDKDEEIYSISDERCIDFMKRLKEEGRYYDISFEDIPLKYSFDSHSSDFEEAVDEIRNKVSGIILNREIKGINITLNSYISDTARIQNFIEQIEVNREDIDVSISLRKRESEPLVHMEIVCWPDVVG